MAIFFPLLLFLLSFLFFLFPQYIKNLSTERIIMDLENRLVVKHFLSQLIYIMLSMPAVLNPSLLSYT